MDGDYMFSQKSEKIAFSHDIIVPSSKPDVRQDTTWMDSLHIKSIDQVDYTHFLPDNIVLRAFTEPLTDRFFLKAERQKPNCFSLFFSYGDSILPQIKGLNFDAENAFLVEASEKKDYHHLLAEGYGTGESGYACCMDHYLSHDRQYGSTGSQ